jgi:Cellulase (glycosyl hydrolase family 5)
MATRSRRRLWKAAGPALPLLRLVPALALAIFVAGCTVQTQGPTNVTSTSATLNADVRCTEGAVTRIWWELREVGVPSWRAVSAPRDVACGRSVGPMRIAQRVSDLRPQIAYEYRVAIDPPPAGGEALYSAVKRFTSGGDTRRPVVASSVLWANGTRLQLKGVNVWGLRDSITTSFGDAQYANRAQVARTIRSWGANLVRFRVLGDEYTRAQLQRIKDWRDAVVGQGMYFMLCSWDALDGAHSDAGWAGNGWRVHQMFKDIHAALGDDPMVIYEVTNEPNNVSWADWDANMRGSISYFREQLGYRGLLVIDPIWWANSGTGGQGYDDARYSALEGYDAARPGMGSHQLAFAKHDYANGYRDKVWDGAAWAGAQGGSQTKHLIFETEFGNYNGDPSTVSDSWSSAAASFFAGRFAAQPNYVGAAAFLFGAWWDANALTTANNASTTTWGSSARRFLAP